MIGGVELPVRPTLGVFTQPFSFIGLPVVSAPVWNESYAEAAAWGVGDRGAVARGLCATGRTPVLENGRRGAGAGGEGVRRQLRPPPKLASGSDAVEEVRVFFRAGTSARPRHRCRGRDPGPAAGRSSNSVTICLGRPIDDLVPPRFRCGGVFEGDEDWRAASRTH